MPSSWSFKNILEKYLNGAASAEERLLVEEWFEAIREEEGGAMAMSDAEKEDLYLSISQSARFRQARHTRPFLFRPSWKAAAIWGGMLLGGWGVIQTFKSYKGSSSQQSVYVKISTGRAEVRKVRLPDSSDLWLNANTVLQYTADFPRHRQVRLDGEALFDVRHQPDHPFIIETPDGLRTEVLGTRFDIKSYDRLKASEITVINGRIRVTHSDSLIGMLVGGQAVLYSRMDGHSLQSVVSDPESLSGWITGSWEFDNKGVDDLALLLNNQFGINLVCRRPGLEKVKISVNFNSKQTADEIIGIFCAFTESAFRWKDRSTVEIY